MPRVDGQWRPSGAQTRKERMRRRTQSRYKAEIQQIDDDIDTLARIRDRIKKSERDEDEPKPSHGTDKPPF